jgi:hypothetical protein
MKPPRQTHHSDGYHGIRRTKKADTSIDTEPATVPLVKPVSLMRTADLLSLQRTVGNQSLQRLFRRRHAKGDNASEFPLQRSPHVVPATVLQRDITVGKETYKPDNKVMLEQIVKWVKGQLSTWGDRNDKLDNKLKLKLKKVLTDKKLGTEIEEQITRLLREKYDTRKFDDMDDLCRQAEQDIMLFLLDLKEFEGTPHQLDQYTFNQKTGKPGVGNKRASFRIYRTMPVKFWNVYEKSGQVGDILHGHGGALGQAMHYFQKSKAAKLDDVLVEFSFTGRSEEQTVDYQEIGKGAEGNASKGGKMGGKSEQNDMLGAQNIFSIHLAKNKDLITKLAPVVRAVEFAIPREKKEASSSKSEKDKTDSSGDESSDDQELSPIDVMIKLGRKKAGALNVMNNDDWEPYYQYKEEHPEYKYSH